MLNGAIVSLFIAVFSMFLSFSGIMGYQYSMVGWIVFVLALISFCICLRIDCSRCNKVEEVDIEHILKLIESTYNTCVRPDDNSKTAAAWIVIIGEEFGEACRAILTGNKDKAYSETVDMIVACIGLLVMLGRCNREAIIKRR